MLLLVCAGCLILLILWERHSQARAEDDKTMRWVHKQLNVVNFHYAGNPKPLERLRLRAIVNHRLKQAFDIDNSLTTRSQSVHKAFLNLAFGILNKDDRNWAKLYSVAEAFIKGEVKGATKVVQLAEFVRCMVLAVVLFDNFGLDPAVLNRKLLVTITEKINSQWLQSKKVWGPHNLAPSPDLNTAISSLGIRSPFPNAEQAMMTSPEILGLLMPQYETLWRVVLLTFVTAYHHQPSALLDTVQRTTQVPSCLGNSSLEKEALKLAKIWGPDALVFRPSRFDEGVLTERQKEAYIRSRSSAPVSGGCGGESVWERMVTALVVVLGRGWGGEGLGRRGEAEV
ncbi:hypothetical protein N0V88_000181 [Collariella sp. IMI 366227]|nr:hypothetical protein N0V88_000181 [Collariella sp. IMI 366227]